jgi:hypothetical protein
MKSAKYTLSIWFSNGSVKYEYHDTYAEAEQSAYTWQGQGCVTSIDFFS